MHPSLLSTLLVLQSWAGQGGRNARQGPTPVTIHAVGMKPPNTASVCPVLELPRGQRAWPFMR